MGHTDADLSEYQKRSEQMSQECQGNVFEGLLETSGMDRLKKAGAGALEEGLLNSATRASDEMRLGRFGS